MPPIFLKGAPAPIPQGESPDKADTELAQASPAEGMTDKVSEALGAVVTQHGLRWDLMAHAAIAAMREPNAWMMTCGEDNVVGCCTPTMSEAREVYQSMIDAALSEKGA